MHTPAKRQVGATLLTFGVLASAAGASGEAASGEAFLLALDHDAETHRAALEDLAVWRRAQEPQGFGARLELLEATQAARAAAVVELAGSLDVEVLASSWLNPSLTVWIENEAELAALEAHPAVRAAHRGELREPNQAQANAAHRIPQAHALSVPGGLNLVGTGVTVALLDSGLDMDMGGLGRPHAAFYPDGDPAANGAGIGGSRVLSSEGFFLGLVGCEDPEDTTGHGTRMGAILAGSKWAQLSGTADGAAPDAWLRSYKITDCNTSNASTITMDMALTAAAGLSDVRVVNLSYDGTADPSYPFNETMDSAEQAGLLVVVSAGNSGAAQSFMHGNFGGLAVGASFVGQAEPFVFPGFQASAIGPLPDGRSYPNMLAVGEQITTAVLDNEAATQDSYGSSGAAASVSGTAALMLQARPSLGPLELKALLLNSLAPVVAGDADAAGLGFLDAEAAVQAALAGDAVQGAIAPGLELRFPISAESGEELRATLTWGREDVFDVEVDDLDLELREIDGTVIAASSGVLDNVETLRHTFPLAMPLELVVRMPASTSVPIVDFALAATSGFGGPAGFGADDFAAAAPSIGLVEPQGVAAGGNYARFFVKGDGLAQTTAVDVSGQPASFQFEAPGRLRVDVPAGTAPGIHTVTVVGPGGQDSATLVVGVDAPDLTAYVNFVDEVQWGLDGAPNLAYGLFLSGSPIPTDFPGLIQLDIGNQGANLFLVASGTLDVFGGAEGTVTGGNALPNGTELLWQAVVFELSTYTLIPSNVVKSLKAIHFG